MRYDKMFRINYIKQQQQEGDCLESHLELQLN